MEIGQRQVGDVVVLAATGKLTIGQGDVLFREAVQGALREGKTKVLFDMGGVTQIDSAGVGELVANMVSLRNRGGRLALLNLSDRVGGVLKATQLTGIFEMYADEPEALASFL
ncbi:MAG TPA: STAS domain-containing protein [Thermoanaerobaculia bacterium]|nr:STAS domain-containing protein [Thermoanaerobaculia bacterium]